MSRGVRSHLVDGHREDRQDLGLAVCGFRTRKHQRHRVHADALRAEPGLIHARLSRGLVRIVGPGPARDLGGGRRRQPAEIGGPGRIGAAARQHGQVGAGELVHVVGDRGGQREAHHHPANDERRLERHQHHLPGDAADHRDPRRAAVASGFRREAGDADRRHRHLPGRPFGERDRLEVGAEQGDLAGADAVAVVGEHRGDGVVVVRLHGGAKAVVGGEQARALDEPLRAPVEQTLQRAFAHLELLRQGLARMALHARVDDQEAGQLDDHEQAERAEDEAPAERSADPANDRAMRVAQPGHDAPQGVAAGGSRRRGVDSGVESHDERRVHAQAVAAIGKACIRDSTCANSLRISAGDIPTRCQASSDSGGTSSSDDIEQPSA